MSLAATIDATGIHAPTYNDVLTGLQDSYRAIFGSDAYLGNDSQDGQLLAVFAQAISDCNAVAVQVYNSFSPAYAQGTGLSSVVKINGLARGIPTPSTATVTLTGQVGTVISNGQVGDGTNTWNLPASVTIPASGSIDVTATAQDPGAMQAAANTLTRILTPTLGWQTANNASAATLGNPVESDAALRQRQTISTAQPAQAVIDAIGAAIGAVTGVSRYRVYENATDTTDANGIPAHSISAVVAGGSISDVAGAIQRRKPPGIQTYGSTSQQVIDPAGLPITINFFQISNTSVYVGITIKALAGYVSTTGTLIRNAIATMINNLDVGEDVYLSRVYAPANLSGDAAMSSSGLTQAQLDALSATYNITALTIGFASTSLGTTDLAIAFNASAAISVADIALTVN